MRMFIVAGDDDDDDDSSPSPSPRVDRENTGTSSNGGVDVAWKAYAISMDWYISSKGAMH